MENLRLALKALAPKVVFLAVWPQGEWEVVGNLAPSLKKTLELVSRQGYASISQLVKKYRLEINAASNRLKRLHDMRLLRREHLIGKQGLTYVYYFWQWARLEPGE